MERRRLGSAEGVQQHAERMRATMEGCRGRQGRSVTLVLGRNAYPLLDRWEIVANKVDGGKVVEIAGSGSAKRFRYAFSTGNRCLRVHLRGIAQVLPGLGDFSKAYRRITLH